MYSQRIVAKRQDELERRHHLTLHRYTKEESWAWQEHLGRRLDKLARERNTEPDDASLLKYLASEEREFIRNEVLLCSIDFEYWLRFCNILYDAELGGGLHPLVPWGPQIILLSHISKMEEEQTDAYDRGESVNGILIALHKARQLGATAVCRALVMHRLTTSEHILGVTASVDDDKILAIQERDLRIYDNLPSWLKPHKGYSEKATHMLFDRLDCKLQYQTLVQKTGIAQGEQYTLGHITEAASDPYQGFFLQKDYFPAIPRAPWVLHIMETTAQGRQNWWRGFVDETRKGFSRWRLVFIPWYAEPKKYRMTPPPDWKPSEEAMKHAHSVYLTSEEFVGKQVMLSRENLRWWEFNRADAMRQGKLNLFLTNYCATIEESFQHTTDSVFPPELLEFYRNGATVPDAYQIEIGRRA
jgi:hypothetical protein